MFRIVEVGLLRSGFPSSAAVFLLAAFITQGATTAQGVSSLYGARGVSPQAVRQGTLGSCYFHASIASLAKAAPEALREAISQNRNGGYRVRFSDGPEEAVYPEDVEFGRTHSYDRSDGAWVLVLMRGYAQHTLRMSLAASIQRSALIPAFAKPLASSWLDHSGPLLVAYDRAIRSVVRQDGVLDKTTLKQRLTVQLNNLGIPSAETQMLSGFLDDQGFFEALARTVQQNGEVFGAYVAVGQGGIPERVMKAFLGTGETQQVGDMRPLVEQLRRVHTGNAVVVADTFPIPPDAIYARAGWWVPNHAFSVLDYEESSQTVRLRNPWGLHPDPDGNFTLPLAVFLQNYQFYSFSYPPTR
jgi:hypothetical protein